MATVKKFEDLEIWQTARILCQIVDRITEGIQYKKNYGLKYQMQDSSGSAMDNIAEGFGRAGKYEFRQFLSVSNGSVSEIKSQLYRSLDQKLISESEFSEGFELADKLSNKIGSFINYLINTDIKGEKFRVDNVSAKVKHSTSNV